jgi:hypothetical protein
VQRAKQVGSTHHSKNVMTTSRPLELLHMDLFGLVAYLSIGGSKYGLVIVDDISRFTWVFFLQDKSETQGNLKRFLRRAQNEFELKLKKIRSDNGSEFKNLQVKEWPCLAQLIFSFFTNLSRSSAKQTASAAAYQFSCFSK